MQSIFSILVCIVMQFMRVFKAQAVFPALRFQADESLHWHESHEKCKCVNDKRMCDKN